MGMILNGIALEGLTRPYGGTFLVFSDYMRPAVRLAAIQQAPVTYVWTHDSIGLGEDGPTHQPIEHLAPSARSRDSMWSVPRTQRDGGRVGADPHQRRRPGGAVPDAPAGADVGPQEVRQDERGRQGRLRPRPGVACR